MAVLGRDCAAVIRKKSGGKGRKTEWDQAKNG